MEVTHRDEHTCVQGTPSVVAQLIFSAAAAGGSPATRKAHIHAFLESIQRSSRPQKHCAIIKNREIQIPAAQDNACRMSLIQVAGFGFPPLQ
jgi:hypothetical protein